MGPCITLCLLQEPLQALVADTLLPAAHTLQEVRRLAPGSAYLKAARKMT